MGLDGADAGQWRQAARVRAAREEEAGARQQTAAMAVPAAPVRRSRGRVVVLAVAFVVVVGASVGALLFVNRGSSAQPAWVRQLGLGSGVDGGGATPGRFGRSSSPDAGASATTVPVGSAAGQPVIDPTGEDFGHVWTQIEVLESWLLRHPDPSAVSEIYVPGTAPADQLVAQLTKLEADHQNLDVQGYRILGVAVDGRPSPDEVDLRYADTYTDGVTLDAHGAVVSHAPYDGRARLWKLTLERGRDHRWRVKATSFLRYGDKVPPS